jgi:hypothetical protein
VVLADWITLNIPWWAIVLGVIGLVFWPLTIAAAITGFVAWRTRAAAARILFAIPLALWVVSAGVNLIPYVARVVEYVQIHSRHYVPGTGMTGDMTLPRDTAIDGVLCSSKEIVHLGFLGTLSECTLAHPQFVRGVPCMGKVNVDYRVQCTLASDYRRFGYVWRESTLVRDNGGNDVSFQIGAHSPTLTVLGSELPQDAEVTYDAGKLLSINLVSHPIRHGECTIVQVLESDGGFQAECTGGLTVALPHFGGH